ncbi:MAG: hypothetical protein RIQ94_2752 [Pseudomonadota bacterium]|jgi:hypothetical protein
MLREPLQNKNLLDILPPFVKRGVFINLNIKECKLNKQTLWRQKKDID